MKTKMSNLVFTESYFMEKIFVKCTEQITDGGIGIMHVEIEKDLAEKFTF